MLTEAERSAAREAVRSLSSMAGTSSAEDSQRLLAELRRLVRFSPKQAADTMFSASALKRADGALTSLGVLERVRTFLVRSVTLEPVLPALVVEAALQGFALEVELGGYGSFVDELMNSGSALDQFSPELVLVVLHLEDIAGTLADVCASGSAQGAAAEVEAAAVGLSGMLRSLRERTAARVVLQGFVVPDRTSLGDVAEANGPGGLAFSVSALNERLAEVCRAVPGCAFFDVDRIAARSGRSRWMDPRMFLASRLPLAPDAFGPYARGLVRTMRALFRPARKVLCTDLDNTLWGGILGEEGTAGIATGSAFPGNCYREYQRYLKQLRARGVLLAAVSKNNEADVREAFALRSQDLALCLGDFVALKISWDDKVNALRELARELSLGLDSFVFVDDNPVECEAVRQHLPEVAVVQVRPDEPWRQLEELAQEGYFDVLAVTDDDRNRSGEYRAQAERQELAERAGTREDFLQSLGIICTFVPAVEAPLSRSVQMLGKTNQFNLTTRRHSAADVERFAHTSGGQAIAMRVRDRFGDAGVVGLALARTESGVCRIDTLLLSCRVIGRGVETALLAEVIERARRHGAQEIVGEYIPTRKNSLCAGFYPDHGFVAAQDTPADGEPVRFFLDIPISPDQPVIPVPAWLTLEGRQTHELATGAPVAS